MHPYNHYRARIYFRHFRRLGLTALAAWKLANLNAK
jgi:hypothetical protein